jgi:hypothetical protein
MEDEAYYRAKAAKCRRLIAGFSNANDPAIPRLLAMAEECEAKAALYASKPPASPTDG